MMDPKTTKDLLGLALGAIRRQDNKVAKEEIVVDRVKTVEINENDEIIVVYRSGTVEHY